MLIQSLFNRLPLMAKLLMLAIVPLLLVAFLTIHLLVEKNRNLEQVRAYLVRMEQSANVSRLIQQLQIERRLSFDYALTKTGVEELKAAWPMTNSMIKELEANHDELLDDFPSYTFLHRIDTVRKQLVSNGFSPGQTMHFFSSSIFRLNAANRLPTMNNSYLEGVYKDMAAQQVLSNMITYQGIINANLYNILYTRKYVFEILMGTFGTWEVYESYYKELQLKANEAAKQQLLRKGSAPALESVNAFLKKSFTSMKVDSTYTASQWQDLSERSLGELRTLQMALLKNVEGRIQSFYEEELSEKITATTFVILLSIILLALAFYLVFTINKTLLHLKEAAGRLSEGETNIPLHVSSKDAIGSLAKSISKVDEKNRELALAAQQIGNGHFDLPLQPRSERDVLGNALVQMKESLQTFTTDLQNSREEFRKLADFMPQIVWSASADGKVNYYNQRWYEITGAREGVGDGSWIPYVHTDDVGAVLNTWYRSIDTGQPYAIELRFFNIKTQEYRWYLGRALPVTDASGKVSKWFGTATDIHDQKIQAARLEELVAQRTLELARSNEDLQQFAHVASHDLKEPLRKIRTFGSRLSQEYGEGIPEKGKIYIHKLQSSAERMANMIDSILNYSVVNATEAAVENVDLTRVMEGIEHDLELLIVQKDALIVYNNLPRLKGVPALIYQLFYNLLNNALKFTREGVSARISIEARQPSQAALARIPNRREDGHFAELIISDNGIGFNPDYAEKMFNVFTRLNGPEKFEGTGLGLALCKKIVYRHGGMIHATGSENRGATFYILLPCTAEAFSALPTQLQETEQ